MKLLPIWAALVVAASAFVVQVDVEPENALGEGFSLNDLADFALEPAKCLIPGRRCKMNKECCSKNCHYINRSYGFCGLRRDDDDELDSMMKCRKDGATCKINAQCCSSLCKSFGRRKQCARRARVELDEVDEEL